jgi:hypothetical protein
MTAVARLWRWIRVPRGAELRLLAAMITLSVGVPRLPGIADLFSFAPHRFGDPETWGVLFAVGGVALAATCYRGRRSAVGRIIAGIGAVCYVALAAATVSATSWGVDMSLALALAWEAGTDGR